MNKIKNQIFLVVIGLLLMYCSKGKTEDIKIENKLNAEVVSAYPGKNRIKLAFAAKDKNISSCEIFWDNKSQSKKISLENRKTDMVEVIIEDLKEAVYNFEVYTYDKNKNAAVAKVKTQAYGDNYSGTLKKRELITTAFTYGKPSILEWENAKPGEVILEIAYHDETDKGHKIRIKNTENKATLPLYKPGTPISYRSLYLPVYNAIDTFYTASSTLPEFPFYSEEISNIINNSNLVASVTAQSTSNLYEGVVYSSLSFKKVNSEPISLFVLKVDLNNENITLSALLPNNKTTLGLQTVQLMAQARHNSGQPVLAAINADFFESGGIPLGPVFINGDAIKTTYKNANVNYFAVKKDNTPTMGLFANVPAAQYAHINNAVGGGINKVVTNGMPSNYGTTDKEPRTVIGYNGRIVYMLVVDGRKAATSVGMTLDQLGKIMRSLGCQQALNLDGGGSSTMVLKNIDNDTFNIVNAYSDANPRAVATSLGIVIK